jgi:hypothetical protein
VTHGSYLVSIATEEDVMPFSPEALQAFANIELTVLAYLLRSLPFGTLALMAVVVLAVSWLCHTETRTYQAHHRHAGA